MPAFKTQLTDPQIDAVIAYVRKLPSAAPATPAQ